MSHKKDKEVKKEPTKETMETESLSSLLQENLLKAEKEATEYKDKYFRTLAEMENTRKRLQQEKHELISYAVDNMLMEFLSPLDNLENALKFTDNLSDELKNWALGFKMITEQFKEVLENHGIVSYESIGQPFDPHFHEAIEIIESEKHEEDIVVSEITKGYRHKERILRVAKVKVSKCIKKTASPSKEDGKQEESIN